MKFEIHGADKNTGEEMHLVVTAADYMVAQNIANGKGILVQAITPIMEAKLRKEPIQVQAQEYDGHRCPSCRSDNTQFFSVIWDSGVSDISMGGSTSGVSLSAGNGFGISSGRVAMSGTQVSMLAQKCEPPYEKTYGWWIFWIVFAAFLVLLSFANVARLVFAFPFICLAAFSIFMILSRKNWNKTEYRRLLRKWEKSVHCNKCGNTWYA